MTEKKVIIFDLGGVLIDWNPKYLYRQIFDDERRMDWFLENVCDMAWNMEQDAGRSWHEAIAVKVLEYPEYAEPIKAYHHRWSEMLNGPIPETVDILDTLRQSKKFQLLGLTNWSTEKFPIALEQFNFLKWFDDIIVSGHEKTRKPFPEIYNILLRRHQVNPATAIFIDDSNQNVQTGRSLGIDSIKFESPSLLRLELENRNIL